MIQLTPLRILIDPCRNAFCDKDLCHHLYKIFILLWKVFLKMFKDRLKLFNDIRRILTRSDGQFTGMLDWRAHDSKQLLFCLDFLTR